jgi:hypothetical protein
MPTMDDALIYMKWCLESNFRPHGQCGLKNENHALSFWLQDYCGLKTKTMLFLQEV